jgi:hypothetical protein
MVQKIAMRFLLDRHDLVSLAQTFIPLVAGALGALLLWHRPKPIGKVVLAYAVICLAVATSPLWASDMVIARHAPIPEVLLETKLAFVIGLAAILAAGGRGGVARG